MLKQELAAIVYQRITHRTLPRHYLSSGSTVGLLVLRDILGRLEVRLDGDKVELGKRLAATLGVVWCDAFSSEGTPSGGGGTLTREFWLAMEETTRP